MKTHIVLSSLFVFYFLFILFRCQIRISYFFTPAPPPPPLPRDYSFKPTSWQKIFKKIIVDTTHVDRSPQTFANPFAPETPVTYYSCGSTSLTSLMTSSVLTVRETLAPNLCSMKRSFKPYQNEEDLFNSEREKGKTM